jgi:K+-transporting ATPase c subunit
MPVPHRREQERTGLVTTFALIFLTVIVFPLTVMLVGTWLIGSIFDRNSGLRRAVDHFAAAWAARRAMAITLI